MLFSDSSQAGSGGAVVRRLMVRTGLWLVGLALACGSDGADNKNPAAEVEASASPPAVPVASAPAPTAAATPTVPEAPLAQPSSGPPALVAPSVDPDDSSPDDSSPDDSSPDDSSPDDSSPDDSSPDDAPQDEAQGDAPAQVTMAAAPSEAPGAEPPTTEAMLDGGALAGEAPDDEPPTEPAPNQPTPDETPADEPAVDPSDEQTEDTPEPEPEDSGCPGSGNVTYQFNDLPNWPQDALDTITVALDEAIEYYNCYSDLSHSLTINYKPGVPTAEANVDGWISFGESRGYMVVATVMHEIGHTMGVGYFPWSELMDGNRWSGQHVNALMASIPASERDEDDSEQRDYITADSQHFWPYGLNYASEHKNEWSLINHVRIVNAMNRDKDDYRAR